MQQRCRHGDGGLHESEHECRDGTGADSYSHSGRSCIAGVERLEEQYQPSAESQSCRDCDGLRLLGQQSDARGESGGEHQRDRRGVAAADQIEVGCLTECLVLAGKTDEQEHDTEREHHRGQNARQ
ncbi:hypothetical protein BJF84_06105 [Rhodococcus sp. CUA-806]|nr:hypothetical protein BJF84_06105 [Rhodococcus sp. CUA-806]